MAGLAALAGEDPVGGIHAVDVIGGRLRADQHDLLAGCPCLDCAVCVENGFTLRRSW